MKSDKPFMEHIAASIVAIESYVAGGRDIFMREQMIRDAVIRNFEIIGEAAGGRRPAGSRQRRVGAMRCHGGGSSRSEIGSSMGIGTSIPSWFGMSSSINCRY